MSLEIESRCAKCGKDRDLTYDLCDQCRDRYRDKLEELNSLDYDVQKEMMAKYDTSSIERAWVIKKWGGARTTRTYKCDHCGKEISEGVAEKHTINTNWLEISHHNLLHHCDSCHKRSEREEKEKLDRRKREDRNKFNSL